MKRKYDVSLKDVFIMQIFDMPNDNYRIVGDVLCKNYQIEKNGMAVGFISKSATFLTQKYVVDVEPGENFLMFLMMSFALDNYLAFHSGKY